jgi:hypothetical protein
MAEDKATIPLNRGEEKEEIDFYTWRDRFFDENSRRWDEYVAKNRQSSGLPLKPSVENQDSIINSTPSEKANQSEDE